MSFEYDWYLERHRANVKRGFEWIQKHIPEILKKDVDYEWQITFAHDHSKNEPDEYEAYDAYFYGGNRSYAVVQAFYQAWLKHIHRNPHHWQHWVLINDDPDKDMICLEMPHNYIVEMICDWWSFSWENGDLTEIFEWYEKRLDYIKLNPGSRKQVEDILRKMAEKLFDSETLEHHGVKGQKWGVKNGPPYPLDKSGGHDKIVEDAIKSGEVSKKINREKQLRHTKSWHTPGRSYLDGDLDYAQELVDKYGGNGKPIYTGKNKQWNHRERIEAEHNIGIYVDADGNEIRSNKAMIVYSKTGTHIYPVRKENSDET
ncbi:MAG: DUF5662 family protein [Eubacteriales bacterium]|nr:DUF5662 family protein [Eubacteriales bacterium]